MFYSAAKKYNVFTLFTAREQLTARSRRIIHLVSGEHGMRAVVHASSLILAPNTICCLSPTFSILPVLFVFFFLTILNVTRGH